MTKRTIIFRADGSPSIGMGHFTRTLALAEMLNEHFHCIFATRKPTEYQITEIEKTCHGWIDLPEGDSHFEVFLTYLKGDEIVVLDNYFFTTEYQKEIKVKGCKLVCIDDMHDKHYVADVVINHAEGIQPSIFSKEAYTQLCLGFEYALLRKEFRLSENFIITKEYSCMIMMGSSDPLDLTEQIIRMIPLCEFNKPIAVVTNKKIPTGKGVVRFQYLTTKEIAGLMDKSEFGIFPASTVALEACAKRLPFICGYFVNNQREIYQGIEGNNLAVCIGEFKKLHKKNIKEAIKTISSKKHYEYIVKQQKTLMDNQSDNRLLRIFQKL